jgi:hypothetical protein
MFSRKIYAFQYDSKIYSSEHAKNMDDSKMQNVCKNKRFARYFAKFSIFAKREKYYFFAVLFEASNHVKTTLLKLKTQ